MSFFRIGSIVLILTGFLHLYGHFQEIQPANEKEEQLIDLMKSQPIDIGQGDTITMMELQQGFSLCFALMFIWIGGSNLMISIKHTGSIRLFAAINTLATATGLGISLTFFFWAPTACFIASLLMFIIAVFRLK